MRVPIATLPARAVVMDGAWCREARETDIDRIRGIGEDKIAVFGGFLGMPTAQYWNSPAPRPAKLTHKRRNSSILFSSRRAPPAFPAFPAASSYLHEHKPAVSRAAARSSRGGEATSGTRAGRHQSAALHPRLSAARRGARRGRAWPGAKGPAGLDANQCGASGCQPITASMTKNPTT